MPQNMPQIPPCGALASCCPAMQLVYLRSDRRYGDPRPCGVQAARPPVQNLANAAPCPLWPHPWIGAGP